MSDNGIERQNRSVNKKGGENRVIIVIGVVIIVLLMAVILAILFKNNFANSAESKVPKREVLVNEENVAEVAQQLEEAAVEQVQPGQYTATMNHEWHFAKGDTGSYDSYVANDIENTNDVYFDVFLENDDENAIYESPIIPRGSELKNIQLNRKLEQGSYDCILVYHLVDDQQNSISTASFTIKIIIEG